MAASPPEWRNWQTHRTEETTEGRSGSATVQCVDESLSGAFQDATGRATSAITVLVFPTNPAWWGATSRRVRVQRPGTDGKYSFVDLPPGDYVLAAVTDMEPAAWRDPAFLRSLVVGGVQVTIGEGEQKTQHLRIDRTTISGRDETARNAP